MASTGPDPTRNIKIDKSYLVGMPAVWRHHVEVLYAYGAGASAPFGGVDSSGLDFEVADLSGNPINWDADLAILWRHPAIHVGSSYPGATAVMAGSSAPPGADGYLKYVGCIPDKFRFNMRRYWSYNRNSGVFGNLLNASFNPAMTDFRYLAAALPMNKQVEAVTQGGASSGIPITNDLPDIGTNITAMPVYTTLGTGPNAPSSPVWIGSDPIMPTIGYGTGINEYFSHKLPVSTAFAYAFNHAATGQRPPWQAIASAFQYAAPDPIAGHGANQIMPIASQKVKLILEGDDLWWQKGWDLANNLDDISGHSLPTSVDPRYEHLTVGSDVTMWTAYLAGGHTIGPGTAPPEWAQIPGVWPEARRGFNDLAWMELGFREKHSTDPLHSVNDYAMYKSAKAAYNYYFEDYETNTIFGWPTDVVYLPNFYNTIALSGQPNASPPTYPYSSTANSTEHEFYALHTLIRDEMAYGGSLASTPDMIMGQLTLPLEANSITAVSAYSNNYLTRVGRTDIAAMAEDATGQNTLLSIAYANRYLGLSYDLIRDNGTSVNHHNAMEQMNEAAAEMFPYYAEVEFDTPAVADDAGIMGDAHISTFIDEYNNSIGVKPSYAEMDLFTYEIMKSQITHWTNPKSMAGAPTPDYDPQEYALHVTQHEQPGSIYQVLEQVWMLDQRYSAAPGDPIYNLSGLTGSMFTAKLPRLQQTIIATGWRDMSIGGRTEEHNANYPNAGNQAWTAAIDVGNMFANAVDVYEQSLTWDDFGKNPNKQNCFIFVTDTNKVAKTAGSYGMHWAGYPLGPFGMHSTEAKGFPAGSIVGRGRAPMTPAATITPAQAGNWNPEMKNAIGAYASTPMPQTLKHLPFALQGWICSNTRSFEQVLQGQPAHSEIICFQMEKYGVLPDGSSTSAPLQTIFIPWDGKSKRIKYIDTQVMYGKTYRYYILGWHLIAGNTYRYDHLAISGAPPPARWNNRLWPILWGKATDTPGDEVGTDTELRHVGLTYSDNYPTPTWGLGLATPDGDDFECGQLDGRQTMPGPSLAGVWSADHQSEPWVTAQYGVESDRRNFIMSDERTFEKLPDNSGHPRWCMYVPRYKNMDTSLPIKWSVRISGPEPGNGFSGDMNGDTDIEQVVPWVDWDPSLPSDDFGTFHERTGLNGGGTLGPDPDTGAGAGTGGYLPEAKYGPNRIDVIDFCRKLEYEINRQISHFYLMGPGRVYNWAVQPGGTVLADPYYKNAFRVRPFFYQSTILNVPVVRIAIVRVGVLEDWRNKPNGYYYQDSTGTQNFYGALYKYGNGGTMGPPNSTIGGPSGAWPMFGDILIAGGLLNMGVSAQGAYNSFWDIPKESYPPLGTSSPNFVTGEFLFEFFDGPWGYDPTISYDPTIVTEPKAEGFVHSFPMMKISPSLYTAVGPVTIKDLPPVPPDFRIYPVMDDPTKLKILLAQPHYSKRLMPISIEETDDALFTSMRNAQGLTSADAILFGADDYKVKFEVYRTTTPPQTYENFSGKLLYTLDTKTPASLPSEAASLTDIIQPNTEYYYCFRTIDKNDYISVPTSVIRVMMVNDNGRIFPVIEPYKIEKKETRSAEKSFRRYLEIDTSIAERLVNHSAGSTAGDPTVPPVGVTLGDQVFDNDNTFKVRIIGKDTGKKIDLNLNFNMDKIRNPKIEGI